MLHSVTIDWAPTVATQLR